MLKCYVYSILYIYIENKIVPDSYDAFATLHYYTKYCEDFTNTFIEFQYFN